MTLLAWSLVGLGVAHVLFGALRFKGPLLDALRHGFFGQFAGPEIRRTAFWFLMTGPLLMLSGQLAVHAATNGDRTVFSTIGVYLALTSTIGVAAFPKSPLWAPLILSPFFMLAGSGAW